MWQPEPACYTTLPDSPGSAGIAELAVFHPVDTVAKRLMSNETRASSLSQLNKVIFRDKAAAPASRKFVSLFPGLGYAAGYKVRHATSASLITNR